MRGQITAPTRRRITQRSRWWKANRDYPEIFDVELAAALKKLAYMALAPVVDEVVAGYELRHVFLKRTGHALYYIVDESRDLVRVVGIKGGGELEPELDL